MDGQPVLLHVTAATLDYLLNFTAQIVLYRVQSIFLGTSQLVHDTSVLKLVTHDKYIRCRVSQRA